MYFLCFFGLWSKSCSQLEVLLFVTIPLPLSVCQLYSHHSHHPFSENCWKYYHLKKLFFKKIWHSSSISFIAIISQQSFSSLISGTITRWILPLTSDCKKDFQPLVWECSTSRYSFWCYEMRCTTIFYMFTALKKIQYAAIFPIA